MQTLTKRKERIAKQLSNSDSLFFLLEVEPLFLEEREVVAFLEKEDEERGRKFESTASRSVPLVGRKLPNCCDCGGTIERDNDYDRKPKFRDCMSRYQARQNVVIDKRPYEQYLSRHYGDLTKVTKMQVFLMLTRLGREDQVENLYLIDHEVMGVPPTTIRHLESVLVRDFEILMRLFNETRLSAPERKGVVVNVGQVLYRLLKKNGVPCCKEEFGLRKEDKLLDERLSECPPSTTSSNDRYRS